MSSDRYAKFVFAACDANGLSRPTPEFKFHPARRWRADFAWPISSGGGVALEVDGGTWSNGRHTRGSGWLRDAEKRRAYAALGFLVIPVTPKELHSGIWVDTAREALRWTRVQVPY